MVGAGKGGHSLEPADIVGDGEEEVSAGEFVDTNNDEKAAMEVLALLWSVVAFSCTFDDILAPTMLVGLSILLSLTGLEQVPQQRQY